MAEDFITRVCDTVTGPIILAASEAEEALAAFEDTLAVSYAGWHEPVTQALLPIYRSAEAKPAAVLLDGTHAQSIEHAAFVHATAGHALDYDDVHLISVTHPSVVIVPTILSLLGRDPSLAYRALPAFAAGVGVNIALGRVLGFSHYDKGWHATSTIGGIAGAAAAAHLLGFDGIACRRALALAAAQASGLQRNFGTMAKPVHAGLAAAAAVRSALMAEAMVTSAEDIFGPRGFFDLYAGPVAAEDPACVPIVPDTHSLSRKLFPCCYQTHRIIEAGLRARIQLNGPPPDDALVEVAVPYGTMRPLHITDPRTGLEGKFCATYTLATALMQGSVGLADFEDKAVHRPAIRSLMKRITLIEDRLQGDMPVGIEHGSVRLMLRQGPACIAETEVHHFPGSPDMPADETQIASKVADCLDLYTRRGGVPIAAADFHATLRRRLAAA